MGENVKEDSYVHIRSPATTINKELLIGLSNLPESRQCELFITKIYKNYPVYIFRKSYFFGRRTDFPPYLFS